MDDRRGTGAEPDGGRRRLPLLPDRDAPGLAREFVAEACRVWATPWWADPASLVASELVTNAIRHTGAPFVLRLDRSPAGMTVAVEDRGGGEPRVVPAGERTVGGRGLAIVERLADDWGSTVGAGGKTVWARLAPPAPVPAAAGIAAPGTPATAAQALAWTARLADDGLFEDDPAADHVLLELPWDRDNVVLARSTAGHLAARAGFSVQEIEDLRLAVDEACGLLLAQEPIMAAALDALAEAGRPEGVAAGLPGGVAGGRAEAGGGAEAVGSTGMDGGAETIGSARVAGGTEVASGADAASGTRSSTPAEPFIRCRFAVGPGYVAAAVMAPVRDLGDVAGAGGFGWTLLGALVDELERVAGDDGRLGVRITKRAAVHARSQARKA